MPVSVVKPTPAIFGSRAIVSASVLVFLASMTLSVGGFLFHAIASRRLGVDAYGTLYALISLYTLVGFPVAVFAPVVTRYSAEFGALHDDAHVRGLIGLIVRVFVVVGAVYVLAGFVLAVPLAAYLHVSAWAIPIVGVMAAAGILSATMRAIGQGVHAYRAYAWSLAGEGVVKVAALALLAAVGLSTVGATSAFLCGIVAGAAILALSLTNKYRGVKPAAVLLDWRRIFATTGGAAVLTLTMAAMGFADVLIVKHAFSAQQAGLYAVASLCGKILLYFVGFIPAILIPQATHRHARGERTRKILLAAVLFIALVAIAGVLAFHYGGLLVLHVLTGHAFDAALPLLPGYAAAMAALAMTTSLGSYGLSTHRLAFVLPLLFATIGTLIAIAFVHPTLGAVVNELLIGNLVMVVVVAASLAIQGLRDRHG
jgi:O-antigen/teichoic acid export membrane protein